MSWLDAHGLADVHREIYVAILKSWIPHGAKGEFARRVGITPQYLSYLCAFDGTVIRWPSPLTRMKIARALPAPLEVKQSLLENMELAQQYAARAHYQTRVALAQKQVRTVLDELKRAHRKATFGADFAQVQQAYRMVRDSSFSMLEQLSLSSYPASYAQICMYLHDAQCVLDRADHALRYAKLARFILESTTVFEPEFSLEEIDELEINAIRGEAVAYHNLGLDREVPELYERALATRAHQNRQMFWQPLLGRDLLSALVRIPRSGIRAARKLAYEIEAICEHNADEFTLFLVRETWLRFLIQRKEWKPAERVFQDELERIPRLPYVGPLHRAMLIKTGARLAWEQKDLTGWKVRMSEALGIMHGAGLRHQLRQVRSTYGAALKPIDERASVRLKG